MIKKTSKNLLWMLGTIIALGLSYLFCRFIMFDFHGMKQWPNLLAVVAFAVLLLSFFFKKRCLSTATILGYLGGFIVALLFQSDSVDAGGGRINNLWIIWTVALLICIMIGIVIEIAVKRS